MHKTENVNTPKRVLETNKKLISKIQHPRLPRSLLYYIEVDFILARAKLIVHHIFIL